MQIWSGNLWGPEWVPRFGFADVGCGEMLSLTHPETILDAQRSLLQAGADVVSTNTLGANGNVMEQHGIASLVRDVNFESARLARRACDEFAVTKSRRLAAGSIGPTWLIALRIEEADLQFAALYRGYVQQIQALANGGVDVLHVEGCQNLMIGKAALQAAQEVQVELGRHLPTIATAAIEADSLMIDGSSYTEFCEMVAGFRSVVCGFSNCDPWAAGLRNPEPKALFGNAFLNGAGWAEQPDVLAEKLVGSARAADAAIVGVVSGSRPEYITALANCIRQ